MITVRFENGHAVQYNSATHVVWGSAASNVSAHRIYDKNPEKGGRIIAAVPMSAIIEFVAPCRVYQALHETQLAALEKELRAIKRKIRRSA